MRVLLPCLSLAIFAGPAVSGGAAKPQAVAVDAGVQAGPSVATSPEARSLIDRMQRFYEKTADFTASFRQDYTYKSFNRTQTSTGKVTFLKPAMMRWDYEKPSPKTFVLSGERVYAYDPEAMIFTIAAIKSNELSAAVSFLWGVGKLEKEFSIASPPCEKCQGVLLELTPRRQDPRFQRVRLEIDPKTAQVLKSVVVDPDGSENAITFSELRTNQGITKERFKIKPPADAQIVDLTKNQQQ
ncbi:MAG TPA: outer membrane lipoprotein carrier protein LolA [Myxococcaceae bacterium]|nr:outer membrane lipoprotein carrier protein LolA [Myxococcaceae bacterium]